MAILREAGGTLLEVSRYHPVLLRLLRLSPYDIQIERGSNVSIGSGNTLRGEIELGDDVSIESNNLISGTISLGEDSSIGSDNMILGDVRTGQHSLITDDCVVNGEVDIGRFTTLRETAAHGNITIGKYCIVAPEVRLQQQYHDMNRPALQEYLYMKLLGGEQKERVDNGPISIGHDVWLGARSTILSGVDIGHGAVVGAGAVVTRDVEPYAVVAGVPAERIKWRFNADVRTRLLEMKWWDWSLEEIAQNESFFRTPLEEHPHEVLDDRSDRRNS